MQQVWNAAAMVALTSGTALAQSGVLDQDSPIPIGNHSSEFNEDASFLIWQQQVRVGIAGQLEGIRLTTLDGPVGSQFMVTIRLGPAWSTAPAAFTATVTRTLGPQMREETFVNMTSSGIHLTVGQTFVIETQGNGTGVWLGGSYVQPTEGPPLYAEPLFLTGSLFTDDHWRHGFQTYMITGGPSCYPNCDASTVAPILNVQDFTCFLTKFASGDPYANCDASTTVPVLNVQDFSCFLQRFAVGCP